MMVGSELDHVGLWEVITAPDASFAVAVRVAVDPT
jgi:hypothetical protein